MNILESILLGAIQGVTEFLPISSSGHLIIFQSLLNIKQPGNDFEILVHLGTLGSVVFVFYKDILNIFKNLNLKEKQDYVKMIILGTFPAIFVGLFSKDYIDSLFDGIENVAVALIFTGIILILTYFINRKNSKLSFKIAFLIGISQSVAIIPGISRSGMTISTGMFFGLSSKNAARFSFMLAIPAISGAGVLNFMDFSGSFSMPIEIVLTGLMSSFIVGIFSLKLLLNLLTVGKFHFFGLYCLIVGIITMIK